MKKEKLDIKCINEMIHVGSIILKIFFGLMIITSILLITYIFKEWNIGSFLGTLLKVISPIFIGFIIAWLCDPIVSKLKQKGLKRVFGTTLVYVAFLSFVFIIIRLMYPILSHQINDFVTSLPTILESMKEFINDIIIRIESSNNFDLNSIKVQIFSTIETFGVDLATKLPTMVVDITKNIISGGATLILGLMIGFYMLIDYPNVIKHCQNVIPLKNKKEINELFGKLNHALRSFVNGTLFIMLLVFIFQSIGLTLAGLKASLLFGMFCAITNIIPYFGPYIGGIPVVIIGLSQSPLTGFFALISVVVIQLVESSILQPIVMGHTMKLHPVTIMLGLLLFQYFFGIIGMIIATPVIAGCKIILLFILNKINESKHDPIKKIILSNVEKEK
ncbi:MAG: AI-2E family transporter [Bacilli bacterium]